MNNLKQISLAALSHESAKKFLPSGGWGNNWQGDPDAGYGRHQPGGWAYSTMMYMEANTILQQAAGLPWTSSGGAPNKFQVNLQNVAGGPNSAQPGFMCPSRRPVQLYPIPAGDLANPGHYANMTNPTPGPFQNLAKGDYAGNGGDLGWEDGQGTPNDAGAGIGAPSATSSLAQLEAKALTATPNAFGGTMVGQKTWVAAPGLYTGIFWQRSETSLRMVSDGASKVYMVGEKSMSQLDYMLSQSGSGDEENLYVGHDDDNIRLGATPGVNYLIANPNTGTPKGTFNISSPTTSAGSFLLQSTPRFWVATKARRGPTPTMTGPSLTASAVRTRGAFNMAFCDGSVHPILYEIDPLTHAKLSNRNDGQTITDTTTYLGN